MGVPSGWVREGRASVRWSRTRGVLIVVVLALMLLGSFVDFAPAPFFWTDAWQLAMLAIGIALLIWMLLAANRRGRLRDIGVLRIVGMCAVLPVLFALCAWMVLSKGLPWIVTKVGGTEFQGSTVMRTSHRALRACPYRLLGDGMVKQGVPSLLCIDAAIYRQYPERDVQVVLSGRYSIFGRSIDDVAVLGPASPPPR